MFKTLVKKEILNNLLNLRFVLAYFLCALLIIGSATVMISDYAAEKKAYEISKSLYERRDRGQMQFFDYVFGSKIVERPPVVTRILALGGEKDADPRALVSPELSPYFFGDFKRNPLLNLFPSVDLVFIIGIIISLLVFMLTYDAIPGEREEGTLKVLLSCPVPRDLILAAKWVGGFISLILPIVTSALVVMIMLLFSRDVAMRADDWVRMAGIVGMCILYITVLFSMSLAVSVLFKNSASVILALLLLWVVWIITIPAISAPLAHHIVNPPGVWQRQVNMSRIGIIGWNQELIKLRDAWIAKYGKREYEELTQQEKEDAGSLSAGGDLLHTRDIMDSIQMIGKSASRTDLRIELLGRNMARISPYGCLQNACVALAGTGMAHELALRSTVETYEKGIMDFAAEKFNRDGPEKMLDPSEGPSPVFPREGALAAVQYCIADIGILVIMGILFFMIAYLVFIRMEIL